MTKKSDKKPSNAKSIPQRTNTNPNPNRPQSPARHPRTVLLEEGIVTHEDYHKLAR